jgi:methionine salvage enolase-phosphatase E1
MNDLTKCSNEELRAHLITLDGKGKEFKQEVLEELMGREYQRGYEQGSFDQSYSQTIP